MINVGSGKYYVVLAEVDTGIVLTLDGKRNLSGKTQYEVFDCIEDAEDYSYIKTKEISNVECNIYDDKSQRVRVIQDKSGLKPS